MEETMKFFNDTILDLGYEMRDGQTDMALDIVDAMKDKQHIVVEAGVGIGKSFAYLVPLILYNKLFNEPIIIATSSITLQEQLIDDIAKLSELLEVFPEVIFAKGMRNYACLKKCLDMDVQNNYKSNETKELIKLVKDGVIDKAKLPPINNSIWLKITAEDCKSNNCDNKRDCELIKNREKFKVTQGIIVTNQDMLIRNLMNRENYERELFNSNVKFVVIDEAHNLEEKVRNAYTNSWNYYSIRKDLNELSKGMRYNASEASVRIDILLDLFDTFYSNLNNQIEDQLKGRDIEEGSRYFLHPENMKQIISEIIRTLHSYLILIISNSDDRYEADDDAYRRLNNLHNVLEQISEADPKWLYWLNRTKNNKNSVSLDTCPKKVNYYVEKLIFEDYYIKSILTSATITHLKSKCDEESYSYFINNTGFPIDSTEGFLSSPKESPFPYDEHAILYTSDNMPQYNHQCVENYIEEGVKEIISLANITNGKMLVLFTAKKDMNDVHNKMKDMELPWNTIIQDGSSSQLDILDKFKIDTNSILLGTGAFWEGISIEGETLSCVVIFRLPFPVPDPIINYKCEISENSMNDVLLPHMTIKLKQGIGRLIRNNTDKGIVAILDPRLGITHKKTYKEKVLEALPIKNRTTELNVIREFYNTVCKHNSIKN